MDAMCVSIPRAGEAMTLLVVPAEENVLVVVTVDAYGLILRGEAILDDDDAEEEES